jgi:hypothetical protein
MKYMLDYIKENGSDGNKAGFIGWAAWRANRHVGKDDTGVAANFNFLQQADPTVYGGNPGIKSGSGNGLMNTVFSSYLTPTVSLNK